MATLDTVIISDDPKIFHLCQFPFQLIITKENGVVSVKISSFICYSNIYLLPFQPLTMLTVMLKMLNHVDMGKLLDGTQATRKPCVTKIQQCSVTCIVFLMRWAHISDINSHRLSGNQFTLPRVFDRFQFT